MLFLNCVTTSENATCIEPKLPGFELGKKSRFAKKQQQNKGKNKQSEEKLLPEEKKFWVLQINQHMYLLITHRYIC